MVEADLDSPPLPVPHPDLQAVVDRIPPRVPTVFKEQALSAASYMTQLEEGRGADNPKIRRFLNQIAQSEIFFSIIIRDRLSKIQQEMYPDPKATLPPWLQRDFLLENKILKEEGSLSQDELEAIDTEFENWVEAAGFAYHDTPDGRYYEVGHSQESLPRTRGFKVYIEGRELLGKLRSGQIAQTFAVLQQQNIGPDLMKQTEDSLILYFSQDISTAGEVEQILNSQGVIYRGPAQDIYELKPTVSDIKLALKTSNDGALGAHNARDFEVTEYTPPDFLENYLNLCLWAGKAPNEPYLTSFVYLVDTFGIAASGKEDLESRGVELVKYPVVYVKHRFDLSM